MSVLNSIIGSSQEVLALRKLISTVGKSDSTALILGASGTGKDLAARALHESSSRKMKPFIPVNCGAIPKDLLESELFGHKKGSFTGAISDRKGRFQLAHQGTLFLDEIGDHDYVFVSFDLYIHGSWDGNFNGFDSDDKVDDDWQYTMSAPPNSPVGDPPPKTSATPPPLRKLPSANVCLNPTLS